MQEASSYSQMRPQFPEQEHLKCPRCDSPNTKFCYYNNYNLSQPRHFCKNCKRYWTKGGTLRNIPIGGATRKNNKRSSKRAKPEPDPEVVLPGYGVVQTGSGFGSFSSLLVNGQFGSISNGLNLNMSEFEHNNNPGSGSGSSLIQNTSCNEYENGNKESFLGSQNGGDSSCWNSANGWPDLAIFTTPGSSFP